MTNPSAPCERSQPRRRFRAYRLIRAGAERYDRVRHLPRLIPLSLNEITRIDMLEPAVVVARLRRATRAERARARARHWAYDVNRHIGLLQAIKAESAAAETGQKARQPGRARPDPGRDVRPARNQLELSCR